MDILKRLLMSELSAIPYNSPVTVNTHYKKGCITMPLPQPHQEYTIDDIYRLPSGQRAELIDGQLYMMAPPTRRHQQILYQSAVRLLIISIEIMVHAKLILLRLPYF